MMRLFENLCEMINFGKKNLNKIEAHAILKKMLYDQEKSLYRLLCLIQHIFT